MLSKHLVRIFGHVVSWGHVVDRYHRYRVADNVNLPLRIIPAVHEEGRARVNINLKVSADFSYKLVGSNIVVKVRAGLS